MSAFSRVERLGEIWLVFEVGDLVIGLLVIELDHLKTFDRFQSNIFELISVFVKVGPLGEIWSVFEVGDYVTGPV